MIGRAVFGLCGLVWRSMFGRRAFGRCVLTLHSMIGCDNPRDTNAYKHATMDERLAWVKQGIQDGELTGAMSAAYFELPVLERDLFLEGQVQAVHYTPMGLCLHDFAIEPCSYHLNCVRGCPDYLRQKENVQEKRYLLQLKAQTEQALNATRQQERARSLAPAWVVEYLRRRTRPLGQESRRQLPDSRWLL